MPVMRQGKMEETKPSWCRFSAYGVARYPKGPIKMDLHYHDCDEYFFVVEGRMRVRSEGEIHEVGPGDAICTRMGDEHEVVEVLEDVTYLWLGDELKGEKRRGHLHRS